MARTGVDAPGTTDSSFLAAAGSLGLAALATLTHGLAMSTERSSGLGESTDSMWWMGTFVLAGWAALLLVAFLAVAVHGFARGTRPAARALLAATAAAAVLAGLALTSPIVGSGYAVAALPL